MELSADAQAALEMAMNSDLWFSGPRMKVQVSELMCQFANQKSDGIRKAYEMVDAENAELRLQVSALTQALETQKRENQPYIKELERREQTYREALEKILLLFRYGQFSEGLPESLTIPVSRIINDRNICLVVNPEMRGLSIYIDSLNATGGDKPEQEQ